MPAVATKPTSQTRAATLDTDRLLAVLSAVKRGDFSQRLPMNLTGVDGKIADTLNDVIEMNQRLCSELGRISTVVGKEGKTSKRASLPGAQGSWESSLESVNGLRIIHGPTGRAWAIGTHPPGSVRGIAPDVADSIEGAPVSSCWAQVYLNDMPVFTGKIVEEHGRVLAGAGIHWEPLFDVSMFTAAQVEAVEYYASPAETPFKYQRNDPRCGVLVIWTRKSR